MLKPISVQLYSLREEAKNDFVGVLKKVADIGYKGVEPAGFWDLEPAEFKKIVEDLGMEIYSAHSPWARPDSLDVAMEQANILDLKTIVCGYGANDFVDMDAIKRTAETTNKMQEVLAKNGFTLFQHNHDFEFARIDGKLKYETYFELCPEVKVQMDCFWSTNFGAEDAVEMLKKFSDRTILMHIKDGLLKQKKQEQKLKDGILDRKIELRALGTGELDIKSLIEAMPEQVSTVTVELDYCNIDMFEAIEISYKYMTENGFLAGNK
ncbi:MAG: sugar phosphate isomerase/epimerase [Kiritimatiellae bacterium]|jgi:sugar phosphate isomerase/epimerase|nr:sugar phosphate isomerase/epimerase [Kiritimatiellia bacterium]